MLTEKPNFFPLLDHEASQFSQHTICTMASHNRRKSSIDCATVESVLASVANEQPADPPSPHIGVLPNQARFSMAAPPRPAVKHSRALSYTPSRPNRLSLSFPVAPSLYSCDLTRPTPTSSNAPSFPPTPVEIQSLQSPNDPTGLLVALASQERKVLELKEELDKAEDDLVKLKKEWARHEAHKKSGAMRHLQQLQPMPASIPSSASLGEDTSMISRQSLDADRRKLLLSNINIPKEPRRKVISGGHTRALSLLSPERMNFARPFQPVKEDDSNGVVRNATDLNQGMRKFNTNRARHSYQGGVTHGAKQIAEDVKAGLWTFLEDLRQATVGDEGVHATKNRTSFEASQAANRRGSRGSLLSNERGRNGQGSKAATSPRTWDSLTGTSMALLDTSAVNWPDIEAAQVLKPASDQEKPARTLSLAAPPLDDLDDGWSAWDTPSHKSPIRWSGSTDTTELTTPSNGSVDDRGVRIARQSEDGSSTPSKSVDLQWPGLENLKPGNLKRTVSTIMKEWEKSLTPPQEGQLHGTRGRRGRDTGIETPSRTGGGRTGEMEKVEVGGAAKQDELMMS